MLLYHMSFKRHGLEELMADYDHLATLFEWVDKSSQRGLDKEKDKENDSRVESVLLWNDYSHMASRWELPTF